MHVPEDVQLARLVARDHVPEAQARAAIASQIPADVKCRLADVVLDNQGTVDDLAAQLRRERLL